MKCKSIAAGLTLVALGLGCSPGRKQYQAPGDQSQDKKADRSDLLVPLAPSNAGAGLVDGWYVEPTAEQEAKLVSDSIRAPIELGLGMAGVNISMSRSEIEAKIGQPDYVGQDGNLRPVGVYGGGSFLVFYDRATKNKVEMLLASNGYLGKIGGFDLTVGSDLAPLFAAEGGESGVMKKLFQSANAGVENCEAALLCQLLKGPNLALLNLTNTVSILYQNDPTKPEKKIFEIRISQRSPNPGRFDGGWNLDVLTGALSHPQLPEFKGVNPTWGEIRAAGALETLVEPRDFGRNLTTFSVNLSNDLGLSFARSDSTDNAAKAPLVSDKLLAVSAGGAFSGTLSVGASPLELQVCPQEQGIKGEDVIVLESLEDGATSSKLSTWKVSVTDKPSTDCGSADLVPDPSVSLLRAAIQALGPNTVAIIGKENLKFDSNFDESPNLSLVLAKSIFNQTYDTVYKAALAKSTGKKVLQNVPFGTRSLEESATYGRTLEILDDKLESGHRVGVYYFESNKTLLIENVSVGSQYHNVNTGLSVLQSRGEALSVDLDVANEAGGISIKGVKNGRQVGTLLRISPFDRSLRYAKVGFGPTATPVTDLATFSDNYAYNMTDGTTVLSKTRDLLVATRGLLVSGDRVAGRTDTDSVIAVTRVEVSDLPLSTVLSLSCQGATKNFKIGDDFSKVYSALSNCSKFLTPGYSAERVPTELHIAPEDGREHGLTLSFSEELLTGYAVYNVN